MLTSGATASTRGTAMAAGDNRGPAVATRSGGRVARMASPDTAGRIRSAVSRTDSRDHDAFARPRRSGSAAERWEGLSSTAACGAGAEAVTGCRSPDPLRPPAIPSASVDAPSSPGAAAGGLIAGPERRSVAGDAAASRSIVAFEGRAGGRLGARSDDTDGTSESISGGLSATYVNPAGSLGRSRDGVPSAR